MLPEGTQHCLKAHNNAFPEAPPPPTPSAGPTALLPGVTVGESGFRQIKLVQ